MPTPAGGGRGGQHLVGLREGADKEARDEGRLARQTQIHSALLSTLLASCSRLDPPAQFRRREGPRAPLRRGELLALLAPDTYLPIHCHSVINS